MKKISKNNIGIFFLSIFILVIPILTNSAYSLNYLPGISSPPQGSVGSTELGSVGSTELGSVGSTELGSVGSNSVEGLNVLGIDDDGIIDNNNDVLKRLLEFDALQSVVNPEDDKTRQELKEITAGQIANKLKAGQVAGSLEALQAEEEAGSTGTIDTIRSIQESNFNRLESLELAASGTAIISELNPPFKSCKTADADMEVHTIKGKTDLKKILNNLKNNDDVSIELIVDNAPPPTDTSLILTDSPTVQLKGIISIDPYDSDPKQYQYDISHINTDCITKTLSDETLQVESGIEKPLVIPHRGATPTEALLSGDSAKFFQTCTSPDFSKYKLIGTSHDLQHKDPSRSGKVDLTVKIFVDLNVGNVLPSRDAATVTDDNRIVAMKLIADEGKNDEKKFDLIPKDALSECTNVNFLQAPQNIADNKVFGNPLYGFETKE